MPTITGTIYTIRFQNPTNAWSVVTVETKDGKSVAAAGIMPGVKVGMTVRLDGEMIKNKYGTQLSVQTFMEKRPEDVEGIYKYLSSGLIKNIGPVFARKIVDAFGEETLDILDNEPERLAEIKGVGKERIKSVVQSVKEQKEIRAIMIWLKRYDLPNGLSVKIYKTYEKNAVAFLEENPYRLSDDIKGIGFKKADEVARKLGIPYDSDFRIQSATIACLEDWAVEGNTYMPLPDLIKRVASEDYTNLPEETVEDAIGMGFLKIAIDENDNAALPQYANAEESIATRMTNIQNFGYHFRWQPDFEAIARDTGMNYSDEQQLAIRTAIQNPILILTGGPGTGKTATVNAIINELERHDMKVVLTAPTGRAAKRMSEVTHHPAKTIHRLLEFRQGTFERNQENPISAGVIIVDEASMIDTVLMKNFLQAVSDKTKLIIVGDTDQLPSVGAGCVLRDLIHSNLFSCVRLNRIFRQAQGSDIINNAHTFNRGFMPKQLNNPGSDFGFATIEEKLDIQERILSAIRRMIDRKAFDKNDIQVLTPMKREGDPIGATEMNRILQKELNPEGKPVTNRGNVQFLTGDRIMVTKNDYEKNVFNGDVGFITRKADPEKEDNAVLEARFDDQLVRFTQSELNEIELAYACTIHKSQGSEYPAVIIPVHKSHFIMLKRNLVYTGLTRAKKYCLFVGQKEALNIAVRTEDTKKRLTQLQEKLAELNPLKTNKISQQQQRALDAYESFNNADYSQSFRLFK